MIITLIVVAASWITVAVAICWGNYRWRMARPDDPGDPDATAEDYDDDRVERMPSLPPVPLPDRWSDADDAMLAWFVAGGAER